MNLAHKVAQNIALKKAGLGFIVGHRRAPVPSAEILRTYEAPLVQLKMKHGRTEAGDGKISRRRRRRPIRFLE